MGVLEQLYSEADVPDPREFLKGNRYKVIAFDGVPKLPCHYKYFALDLDNKRMYIPEGMVGGYNKSLIFRFGELRVISRTMIEGDSPSCMFEYLATGGFMKGVVDYIKRIADGFYIGKFYRKGEFKGYFLLVREE